MESGLLTPEIMKTIVESVKAELIEHFQRDEEDGLFLKRLQIKKVNSDVPLTNRLPTESAALIDGSKSKSSPPNHINRPEICLSKDQRNSFAYRFFDEHSAINRRWGRLFEQGNPTLRLEQLLTGVANRIVSRPLILRMY
jgi:hypothetical protein